MDINCIIIFITNGGHREVQGALTPPPIEHKTPGGPGCSDTPAY